MKKLTPKAKELLIKIEHTKTYSLSNLGDLIFDSPIHHSRQAIALAASRFCKQLMDKGYIRWDKNKLYYLTYNGNKIKKNYNQTGVWNEKIEDDEMLI